MPPCLSLSGLASRRQIDPHLFECALYLISRPSFLHFTLNHYTPTIRSDRVDWFRRSVVSARTNRTVLRQSQEKTRGTPRFAMIDSVLMCGR